ncbi:hypothetical protein KC460_04255 [Candidatus Dependentiae bacterium]|nr:hypothetical protein [Candidatus Dependentiae bacterium]
MIEKIVLQLEKGIVMRAILRVVISIALLGSSSVMAMWLSMNAKNDPLPPYTTLDPHTFLYTRAKNKMKDYKTDKKYNERIGFALSPFGQNANRGRDIENRVVPLGDVLCGRWNMVGLLFGAVPNDKILSPTLVAARAALFPTIPSGTPITDKNFIDKNEQFGFFSIASRYRKQGLRFQIAGQLLKDFGLIVEGGVADICHTVTQFKNLTCGVQPDCTSGLGTNGNNLGNDFTENNVNDFLMDQLENIAMDIGLNICNFHKISFEDLRIKLYWRRAHELNQGLVGKDYCWSKVLLIPFIMVGGTVATSKERDPNDVFALTFGNDDHHSVGVTAGLNFDFADTVEIGGEVGITHFFARDFCNYRVPTSTCQQGIFPFTTDVRIKPGYNWHFALKMNAYHFLKCLSFYFQYVVIQHESDDICLKCHDDAFVPSVLEKKSTWKMQVANIGFNYDISPSISLGFLWQAPLARKNAFRSTTVMFSFNAQF